MLIAFASSLLRLCRSTTSIKAGFCSNLETHSVENRIYNKWTEQWIRAVYPSNFLRFPDSRYGDCFSGGHLINCTAENRFFPWTSMGSTYNWNVYSGADGQKSLQQGLYEYGIPKNVSFHKQHLQFIPIDKIYSSLCREKTEGK